MCLKTIYFNTYGDGSSDVTERVDTCRPGKMCAHPEVREVERKLRYTRLSDLASGESASSVADRKPRAFQAEPHLAIPTSPRRSKSPSPSRRETGVFVNGTKIAETAPSSKRRSHHHREDRDRVVVVPHAPDSPFKRSNTIHAGQSAAAPRRESRHISRHVPVGPVPLFDDMAAHRHSHSRSPSPFRGVYYRKHSRNDEGYVLVDPEREERHRRRLERRASVAAHDSDFSSSTATAATSTARHTDAVYMVGPSRAATEVRKELRFQDEIEAHNERIARRPKLHQEVKGILKKTTTDLGATPASPKNARKADPLTDLRHGIRKMDLNPSSKPARPDEDPEYWDRLRGRFGEQPRDRDERKRRTRVYYPGEGLYKYL